jgi:hypothetical protein
MIFAMPPWRHILQSTSGSDVLTMSSILNIIFWNDVRLLDGRTLCLRPPHPPPPSHLYPPYMYISRPPPPPPTPQSSSFPQSWSGSCAALRWWVGGGDGWLSPPHHFLWCRLWKWVALHNKSAAPINQCSQLWHSVRENFKPYSITRMVILPLSLFHNSKISSMLML